MRSIRTRLAVGLVTAMLAVALVAGTVLVAVVRHRVTEDFDAALSAKARALSAIVTRTPAGKVDVDFPAEELGEFAAKRKPEYLEVRDATGAMICRSRSLGGASLSTVTRQGVSATTLPDGRAGRAVAMTFVPVLDEDGEDQELRKRPAGPPPTVTLVLARGTEPIGRTLEVLAWGLACAGAVMMAGAAGAVWVLVGRGLRPLRGVAEQAGRIDAGSLSARFGTDVPTELAPIVARLNELLARLEAAFARERRFTAAAAHELRTPIAELRAMAEVALRWPGERHGQGMVDVLAVAKNMEALAGALLALSRCESGQERAAREPVDLRAAVARAWEGLASRAAERGVVLRVQSEGDGSAVLADRAMVEAVARNLLENAVAYAPEGAEVDCWVCGGGLAVTNPQEGLTDADMADVFEPFWRKDKARAAGDGGVHAGLGLSLVKAYAAAMCADVRATLTAEKAFRVELTFASRAVMVPSCSETTLAANAIV